MQKDSSTKENYYDILNVRRDCKDKDIKAAYVELSKKFHPDVKNLKNDSQQTARFLKIAEAYQTLSKPKLRSEYDKTLQDSHFMNIYESTSTKNEFIRYRCEIKPNYDSNPGPYYGIHGLKKTTNSKVALFIIALGMLGAVVHFVSVKRAVTVNQKRLDAITARASEHHQKILSEVEKYSKEEQLRRVIDRMKSRAER